MNKELLINISKKAIQAEADVDYKVEEDNLQTAKNIFKLIKEMHKNAERNYGKIGSEMFYTEADLTKIFDFDYKGLTPNQKYLKHQSLMINSIYKLVEEGVF